MSDQPHLARTIEINAATQGEGRFSLRIDGVEFPYWVSDVEFTPDPNYVPSITLRILAERVFARHVTGQQEKQP